MLLGAPARGAGPPDVILYLPGPWFWTWLDHPSIHSRRPWGVSDKARTSVSGHRISNIRRKRLSTYRRALKTHNLKKSRVAATMSTDSGNRNDGTHLQFMHALPRFNGLDMLERGAAWEMLASVIMLERS
jgi:hypothetical protein